MNGSLPTLDVAARLTTGRAWPDGGTVAPADVVLLSAEDGPADTIRPRVDALGGDRAHVHLFQAIRSRDGERPASLDRDLPALEETIVHCCGSGSWGGQCPSLGDYVTGPGGPGTGASVAGGC